MNQSLFYARYLLFVLSGVSTMIASSNRIDSEPRYVLLVLLLLFFMQQRDFRLEKRVKDLAVSPFLVIEAIGLALLAYRYGGLLPVAFLSVLISLCSRSALIVPHMLLCAVCMNAAAFSQSSWLMLAAFNLAAFAAAMLVLRYQSASGAQQELETLYDELKVKHYELEETRRTVIDYAKKVQEHAQIEERNRIAHDLHDDLGHKLIRLKMMLEAAMRLDGGNREEAMRMVAQVRDQLAESMESLRSTVRRIKPAQTAANQYDLETLISQFARESGIHMRYERLGMPYPLYPSDAIILYRNAQEAVTNAIRHGGATEVSVTLDYAPDRLRMSVRNNGALPDKAAMRKGLGLLGMEERVRVVGGSLKIELDTQFEVQTILPQRGAASTATVTGSG